MFGEAVSLDVRGAYAIQNEVCRLREQRGEQLVGYKIGCTSPAIQRQLNITHPVFGRLFAGDSWESGTDLSSTQFSNPAIEGLFAVRLGRDIPFGSTEEEVLGAVESLFQVIEMHNLVFRGATSSAVELIANNAVHAGFVYPTDVSRTFPHETDALSIEIDDVSVATVPGAELRRTIVESLKWLVRELHGHGLGLLAGQTILCGSVAEVYPVSAGSRIAVLAGRFGTVRCTIT